MTLAELQRIRGAGSDFGTVAQPQEHKGDAAGFSSALKEAVGKVDASHKEAEGQIEAFVAGEQENVSEVMIAMNQAQLTFQLMTEVRNRTLETYQELSRITV